MTACAKPAASASDLTVVTLRAVTGGQDAAGHSTETGPDDGVRAGVGAANGAAAGEAGKQTRLVVRCNSARRSFQLAVGELRKCLTAEEKLRRLLLHLDTLPSNRSASKILSALTRHFRETL
jgi:hypothetical protein